MMRFQDTQALTQNYHELHEDNVSLLVGSKGLMPANYTTRLVCKVKKPKLLF